MSTELPTEGDSTVAFGANHKRALRAAFQSIDGLLTEVELALVSGVSRALFSKHVADATPVQRRIAQDHIDGIRERMRERLSELDVPLAPPICGALKAARTALIFAGIDLAEIAPSRMLGFGALSAAHAGKLREVQRELKRLLSALEGILAAPAQADLAALTASIKNPSDTVRLLVEIERITSRYKLIQFREALTQCIERARKPSLQIAVFGRTNCGKSTLLNYLLQSPVLPVGVTPVTAVPVSVVFGEKAGGQISFNDGRVLGIRIEELKEFATEERNPQNRRHLTRIEVALPAKRLHDGITLVDTPGLASLAGAAEEETIAYLPRCDIGLVLIDSASGPSPLDLRVVEALRQTGATTMVLLSKADLLTEHDRARMLEFLQRSLSDELQTLVPVYVISARGETALADFWWEGVMKAHVENWRQSAATALRNKVAVLRHAVMEAIRHRIRLLKNEHFSNSPHANPRLLLAAEQTLDEALHSDDASLPLVAVAVQSIANVFAKRLVRAWKGAMPVSVSLLFSESVAQILGPVASSIHDRYIHLRDHAESALEKSIPGISESVLDELPGGRGLPAFETALLGTGLKIDRPGILRLLGETYLTYRVRVAFMRQLGDRLGTAIVDYNQELHAWLARAIQELQSAFEALANFQRDPSSPSIEALATNPEELERDLAKLEAGLTAISETPISQNVKEGREDSSTAASATIQTHRGAGPVGANPVGVPADHRSAKKDELTQILA